MVKVSLVKVDGDEVFAAVKRAVDLVGGIGRYVGQGDRVLIKVNMFVSAPAHVSRITDPRVAVAVARLVHEAGGDAVVADRTDWIHKHLEPYPEIGRYAAVASFDDMPFKMKTLHGARHLQAPIPLPDLVDDCDVFINVPGLRTHQLTQVSNGMKNLMGLLPGTATLHVHNYGLEGSIVDLNFHRPSDLTVTDALVSLEGNFPPGGEPKETNLIAASANVVAMDAVAVFCAGYAPRDLPYLVEADERGLGPIDLPAIWIVGEPLAAVQPAMKLTLNPVSLEAGGERLKVLSGRICEGCRRALGGAMHEIKQSPDYQDLDPVTVIVGCHETSPLPGPGPVILFGNCTYTHRCLGEHLRGCPPLVSKGRDVILDTIRQAPLILAGANFPRGLKVEEWPDMVRALGVDGLELADDDLAALADRPAAGEDAVRALRAGGVRIRLIKLEDGRLRGLWPARVARLAPLARNLGADRLALNLTDCSPARLPAAQRRAILTELGELAGRTVDFGLRLVLEDDEADGDELMRLFHWLHGAKVALGLSPRNLRADGAFEQAAKRILGAAALLRGTADELLRPEMAPVLKLLGTQGKRIHVCLEPGPGGASGDTRRIREMMG